MRARQSATRESARPRSQDVIDEQRRSCHQRGVLAEILPADDVGAAAARVGEERLAVRHHDDGEQDGHRNGDGDELGKTQRQARAADGDDEEDLLGGVGGG
jgi:hypothetical protein